MFILLMQTEWLTINTPQGLVNLVIKRIEFNQLIQGGDMKREILFRGVNFQKEWVYGDLIHSYANDDIAIVYYREGSKTPTFDAIFPESFGQYTGLTDKNGVKIFEGDIISLGDPNIKYLTMWRNAGFAAKQIGASSYIGLTYWASDIEVLGNVIDNPELIK